ncbi:MAG: hypothetical protein H6766_01235 [Candidatus Peribacteria bacterium]|nr:MAG: hypothetical protein H6766_01235 [Candidatus Peribacteria bacterium]
MDVVDSSTSYQWSCIGEDGGTSVTCTEAFPPTYGWDTGEWSVCTESVTNSCEWNGATYDPSGRCASTCFIADTLVIMGDGRQIPIQDVRIGDQLQ